MYYFSNYSSSACLEGGVTRVAEIDQHAARRLLKNGDEAFARRRRFILFLFWRVEGIREVDCER